MHLVTLDWFIILALFVVYIVVGLATSRSAGRSASDYFLSGRSMPWWLLGVSMVATTFAIDTPNLVTGIVRDSGVSGNWVWWAFLLTGMLTVFVYARLWRRSGVQTDLEFYRLRYSGKSAAFLQGFRAVYLGVFFNVMIMANVCLAAVKLGGIVLGLSPVETLLIASVVTVAYSLLGGLKSVLVTDLVQFIIAMIGSVWAAYTLVNLPQVGGLTALLEHPNVSGKLNLLPDFGTPEVLVAVLIIPLAVQWWSIWYPGAEPGGGGYIAQRMLSAKSEQHAMGAVLFFNLAHYALRPWPWILVALASLVVFPQLSDIQAAFPHLTGGMVQSDLAYPAMLSFLPVGLLGLVIASLIAAFMSTISTHLNWGASYVVNDFYRPFVRPDASERELVFVGRASTLVLMFLAGLLALYLESAMQAFQLLLSIGAGTGLIFILRWFWWRINAFTEIAGMIVSFVVAVFWELVYPKLGLTPIPSHVRLLLSVGITTVVWVAVTYLTRPTDAAVLQRFYRLIRPDGPGWKGVRAALREQGEVPEQEIAPRDSLTRGLLGFFLGVTMVYAVLFGIGEAVYGKSGYAIFLLALASVCGMVLARLFFLSGRNKHPSLDE
jgi:solute:Na+ symporter, SSS family